MHGASELGSVLHQVAIGQHSFGKLESGKLHFELRKQQNSA